MEDGLNINYVTACFVDGRLSKEISQETQGNSWEKLFIKAFRESTIRFSENCYQQYFCETEYLQNPKKPFQNSCIVMLYKGFPLDITHPQPQDKLFILKKLTFNSSMGPRHSLVGEMKNAENTTNSVIIKSCENWGGRKRWKNSFISQRGS